MSPLPGDGEGGGEGSESDTMRNMITRKQCKRGRGKRAYCSMWGEEERTHGGKTLAGNDILCMIHR